SSGSLVNDGTLTASAAGSELYFQGVAVAQSYSGAGAIPAPLAALSLDHPAGVSIGAGVAPNIVALRVNLIRGVLANSQKITLGAADTSTALTQIGGAGVTGAGGSYDSAPAFGIGAGGYSVSYLQEGASRSTGFEIPPG